MLGLYGAEDIPCGGGQMILTRLISEIAKEMAQARINISTDRLSQFPVPFVVFTGSILEVLRYSMNGMARQQVISTLAFARIPHRSSLKVLSFPAVR